jgi:hypothetical protein
LRPFRREAGHRQVRAHLPCPWARRRSRGRPRGALLELVVLEVCLRAADRSAILSVRSTRGRRDQAERGGVGLEEGVPWGLRRRSRPRYLFDRMYASPLAVASLKRADRLRRAGKAGTISAVDDGLGVCFPRGPSSRLPRVWGATSFSAGRRVRLLEPLAQVPSCGCEPPPAERRRIARTPLALIMCFSYRPFRSWLGFRLRRWNQASFPALVKQAARQDGPEGSRGGSCGKSSGSLLRNLSID